MSPVKMTGITGFVLLSATLCANARAAGPLLGLYNPLGVYVAAGVGRASLNQTEYDPYAALFHHIDGHPTGWEAAIGVRPIPILGAEFEYLDFGHARSGPGPVYDYGSQTQQFLGGETHDRAAALFGVGYLPLPVPWVEPFVKLGWARMWDHDSDSGYYGNVFLAGSGTALGAASTTQDTHPSGAAYGGGIQFHFEQFAVRGQYERISGERAFGGWNYPQLVSIGLSWTF